MRNASEDAVSTLANLNRRVEADQGFLRVLERNWEELDTELFSNGNPQFSILAECFANEFQESAGDEAVVNARLDEFWQAVPPRLRAGLKATEDERAARELKHVMKGVKDFCSDTLPFDEQRFIFEGLNLPYLTITVAHIYQSAGYSKEGAKLLALWIDRPQLVYQWAGDTEESTSNEIEGVEGIGEGVEEIEKRVKGIDGIEKLVNVFRLRALLHLSNLLEIEGYVPAMQAVVYRTVELMEGMLKTANDAELRKYAGWHEGCSATLDEHAYKLVFALMTRRDELIKNRLRYFDMGKEQGALVSDSQLVRYAEYNTEVPIDCYPTELGEYVEYYRGLFLANHGKLLLADQENKHLHSSVVSSGLQRLQKAQSLLVEALGVLQEFEVSERNKYEESGVQEAISYLSVGEEAADIRRHLKRVKGILTNE